MRGGSTEAKRYGVTFIEKRLTKSNYRQMLDSRLGKGDFLVNLSVEVASTALVELCQKKGALYIDTCIEPWPGGYTDPTLVGLAALELRAARHHAEAEAASTAAARRR